ncbi:MAG: leucine-rich repeat domain-containing protein [Planctomycetes bacterium]|nr:leucine-rich repeat domain-containing protein [Planctomycetota bacterium]
MRNLSSLAWLTLMLLIATAREAPADVVTFADPNLEAAVRDQLGIVPPTPVTTADMLAMQHVNAYARDIQDLSGIENARNVQSVALFQNRIADLSPLTGLTSITVLSLEQNRIQSIAPLAPLTNMVDLNVTSNQIDDISAVAFMVGVWRLTLDHNRIRSLSPVSGLTGNLEFLTAGDNLIEDLSPLSGLLRLRTVTLYDNRVTHIPMLSGLPNLIYLNLVNNQITDLSGVADLGSLRSLMLANNDLTDLSPLAGLAAIETLTLSHNAITDIHALADLANLELLELDQNGISDISPLADLHLLDRLDLRGNPLNEEAYSIYLPLIQANNPTASILYDPVPEPGTLALLITALGCFLVCPPESATGTQATPPGKLKQALTVAARPACDKASAGGFSVPLLLRPHLDGLLAPAAAAGGVPHDERHAVLARLVESVRRRGGRLGEALAEVPQPLVNRPLGGR